MLDSRFLNVANMSSSAIRENKILVLMHSTLFSLKHCFILQAFFKRHLKMDNHTLICSQGNGLCQVEGYSKRKCAFCRLQCCHRVGMSKAGTPKISIY